MQLRTARAGKLLVDRLPDQGVSEAVLPDRPGRLLDDPSGDRLLERLGDVVGGRVADPLQDLERELAASHRGERQQPSAVVVESAHAAQQKVLDRLRDTDPRDCGAPVIPDTDVAQDLLDEERIALRALPDRSRERRGSLAPCSRRDEPRDVVVPEPSDPQADQHARATQLGERLRERMGLIHLRLPVGAKDQHPGLIAGTRDVTQEQQRRGVRPVKVIEHEDQRLRVRDLAQQRRDRVEQTEPLALGVLDARAGGRLRSLRGELGQEPGKRRAVWPDLQAQLFERRLGDVVAQGLYERLIGDQRLLVTAPQQDRRAVRVGGAAELRRQPRLADPRLADQHRDAPASITRVLPVGRQLLERRVAADQRRRPRDHERRRQRDSALRRRFPPDLARGQRLGDSLQRQRPARRKPKPPREPTTSRNRSDVRICPPVASSHSRLATMTGVPK